LRRSRNGGLRGKRRQALTRRPRVSAAVVEETVENEVVGPDQAMEDLRDIIPFDVLRTLSKPGRYLGNERGAVRKPWGSCEVKMCLAYPEIYEIGMSNTGHVILYSCVNDVEGALCDRSYLPAFDMGAALKKLGKNLFAVESKKELNEFDILAVPVHYEMGATNCLELLSLASIPILAEDRQDQDDRPFDVEKGSQPLVFAGGQTATANPEPFADFFDFVALGDGEDVLPLIAEKVKECKALRMSRFDTLLVLAKEVPGIYVPMFYKRHEDGSVRRIREDVPARPIRQVATPQPERALRLVPYVDTIHDRLTIEIRRGCTRGCRFCLPGNLNRPARDVEPERVIKGVVEGVQNSGYREFSLLSLSCSDWLSLPSVGIELKNRLRDYNTNISLTLPSQRVDRFDENIALLVAGGEDKKSGITFAPEAGTQRMRDVINKGLTNEDLLRGVRTAYLQGYAQVKLYFMIGLPGETDEDVLGIVETIKWLQRECKEKGRQRVGIKLTISNFTPKPHTPFQWHSVSTEEFVRKQSMLKERLKSQRDVKFNFTDVRISAMEDFIGRADRRTAKVIQRAWERGASMDDWWMDIDKAYTCWRDAIEDCGLTWEYRKTENGEWNIMNTPQEEVKGKRGWYETAREQNLDFRTLTPKSGWNQQSHSPSQESEQFMSPLERPLPWDHINGGIDKGWLRDELMKALTENLTPDCSFDECSSCGVCGDNFGNNVVIEPAPIPEFKGHFRSAWTREQKLRVSFRRVGSAAMIGHLDVNRMLDRVLLRASLPVSFTNGFNQQPRVQPAQPLPLGFTSDAEVFDFEMASRVEPKEFKSRLTAQLPESFAPVAVEEVHLKSPSPSAALCELEWAVALVDNEGTDAASPKAAVERLMSSGPIEVEKESKRSKRKRLVDLRQPLLAVDEASSREAEPLLLHIGLSSWDEKMLVLKYRASVSTDLPNLSPSEFCRLFNIVNGTNYSVRHAHRRRAVFRPYEMPEEKSQGSCGDPSDEPKEEAKLQ